MRVCHRSITCPYLRVGPSLLGSHLDLGKQGGGSTGEVERKRRKTPRSLLQLFKPLCSLTTSFRSSDRYLRSPKRAFAILERQYLYRDSLVKNTPSFSAKRLLNTRLWRISGFLRRPRHVSVGSDRARRGFIGRRFKILPHTRPIPRAANQAKIAMIALLRRYFASLAQPIARYVCLVS